MSTPITGRPASATRLALLAALQAGVTGTFDAIAKHAGVSEHQARYTLANLCREGLARSGRPAHHASVSAHQRLRSIYAPMGNPPNKPLDALRFSSRVWR